MRQIVPGSLDAKGATRNLRGVSRPALSHQRLGKYLERRNELRTCWPCTLYKRGNCCHRSLLGRRRQVQGKRYPSALRDLTP